MRLSASLFGLFCLGLSACATPAVTLPDIPPAYGRTQTLGDIREKKRAEFATSYALWKSKAPQNYRYRITDTECFCQFGPYYGPNQIDINNGQKARIVYLGEARDGFRPRDLLEDGVGLDDTIDGLFARVDIMLVNGDDLADVIITFDPEYGYPSEIAFDHPNWADDQWHVNVYGFEVRD